MKTTVADGLAIYVLGAGPPVLLVPNPQGVVGEPAAAGRLAARLVELGRTVLTFDPPGVFESAGLKPRLTLDEMVEGAEAAIKATGTAVPLPVVGHSQGALAALYLGLARPVLVDRLVLVGAVDGGVGAARRAGGMPFGWSLLEADFWRFAWLGLKLSFGRGSLADQERLRRIVVGRSYVDPLLAPDVPVDPEDARRPLSRRAGWQRATRSVDLQPRLGEIVVPTLVCCGRLDPQTPVRGNAEIADGVRDGQLVVFDKCGHYPFVEAADRFSEVVGAFLAGGPLPSWTSR